MATLEWQPIETAPKDGTDVLLFRLGMCGNPLPPMVAGWFHNGEDGGWCSEDFIDEWLRGTFTHWMPLPAPPARALIEQEVGRG